MADRPNVLTRDVTRDKLAAIFKSHELVKAFENLSRDVGTTLPNATQQAASDAEEALAAAAAAELLAQAALQIGQEALNEAIALAVAPALAQLGAEVAALRNQINDLQQGYQL